VQRCSMRLAVRRHALHTFRQQSVSVTVEIGKGCLGEPMQAWLTLAPGRTRPLTRLQIARHTRCAI
jgi:hypothetical protein